MIVLRKIDGLGSIQTPRAMGFSSDMKGERKNVGAMWGGWYSSAPSLVELQGQE